MKQGNNTAQIKIEDSIPVPETTSSAVSVEVLEAVKKLEVNQSFAIPYSEASNSLRSRLHTEANKNQMKVLMRKVVEGSGEDSVKLRIWRIE